MRVSKRSWHYKLWALVWCSSAEKPKNLCTYFWGIAIPFLIVCVVAFWSFFLVINLAIVFIKYPIFGLSVFLAIILVLGVIYISMRISRWYLNPPSPNKEKGLVRSWLSAKKQKVCPMIEVID